MKVDGRSLIDASLQEYTQELVQGLENIMVDPSSIASFRASPVISNQPVDPLPSHLILSTRRLTFEITIGQVSCSNITVYNHTSIAYQFEWVKIERPNPLKAKSTNDKVKRFYFTTSKGIILPGTAYDFPIVFKSAKPGVNIIFIQIRFSLKIGSLLLRRH